MLGVRCSPATGAHAGRLVRLLTLLILAAGLIAAAAGPALAASSSGGGCNPYVDGTVVPVPCSAGAGSAGIAGTAGAVSPGVSSSCTTVVLDQAQAQNLGLPWPPPAGQSWALLDCLAGAVGAGPQAVLVTTVTGVPQVTPQQLMVRALGELRVPSLPPGTAPPLGTDGLVGLPEWFWVPAASWHSLSVTVSAGPVWATVTALPVSLTVDPGAGIAPVSCSGPGNAYDAATPATQQHTACSYTYDQPSAGLPGNAYQASVTVSWQVTWTGSGGTGGVLAAALSVPVGFTVPVAQGEALVTGP
jgi:hypothetical protein